MHRGTYYEDKLSAKKLLKCYEVASPRIKQYLEAEIRFVISNTCDANLVLELGCGYGRVMRAVSPFVSLIVGVDVSRASLKLAKSYMKPYRNHRTVQMDASNMAFSARVFDAAFCVQNGISTFGVNKKKLITEAVRVTKHDGVILFPAIHRRCGRSVLAALESNQSWVFSERSMKKRHVREPPYAKMGFQPPWSAETNSPSFSIGLDCNLLSLKWTNPAFSAKSSMEKAVPEHERELRGVYTRRLVQPNPEEWPHTGAGPSSRARVLLSTNF